MDDPMRTTSSMTEFDKYGTDADISMNISQSDIKTLIAEKVDRAHAGRT